MDDQSEDEPIYRRRVDGEVEHRQSEGLEYPRVVHSDSEIMPGEGLVSLRLGVDSSLASSHEPLQLPEPVSPQ